MEKKKFIGYLVFIMFINCDYSFKCWMLMYEGSGRVLLFFFIMLVLFLFMNIRMMFKIIFYKLEKCILYF